MRKIGKLIEDHISKNIKTYIILIIIFLVGLILGIIAVNNSGELQETEITTYIGDFITDIKNNSQIDYFKLLRTSFVNNLVVVLIIWFMGSTVIGIPIVYGVIGYKGFCLGYTISSITLTLGAGKGILFVLTSMLLNNIILIPSILLLAISGINLYKSIIKDRRKENIKIEIIRHTVLSTIILGVLTISSLVETYISTNLLISIIKYL